MGNAFFNPQDFRAITPEILLAIFGLAALLFDFLLEKKDKFLNAVLAIIALSLAGLKLALFWTRHFRIDPTEYFGFGGTYVLDTFALVAKLLIVVATAIVVL